MANTTTINTPLNDYVNVHKDELIVRASATFATLPYIDKLYGVKYQDVLPMLESSVVLKDGSSCGWDPNGADTISPIIIKDFPVVVQKTFCGKDFRKSFANYELNWKAGGVEVPFAEAFINSNLQAISDELEKLVWNGDTAIGIDGFLKQLDATKKTLAGTTATERINEVVKGITDRMLKKGVNVFVSPALFRQYIAEQNAECCGNKSVIDAAVATLSYVGDSRVKIIPVSGLINETKVQIVAATADALVYATDIENSENEFRWFRDEKEGTENLEVLFLAGTAVRYADEAQLYVNA